MTDFTPELTTRLRESISHCCAGEKDLFCETFGCSQVALLLDHIEAQDRRIAELEKAAIAREDYIHPPR